jgi:hypothetical protein
MRLEPDHERIVMGDAMTHDRDRTYTSFVQTFSERQQPEAYDTLEL